MYKFLLVLSVILTTELQNASAQYTQTQKDSITNSSDKMNSNAMRSDMNRDSAINIEYRKTRDGMNNRGTTNDSAMHSTFRMNGQGMGRQGIEGNRTNGDRNNGERMMRDTSIKPQSNVNRDSSMNRRKMRMNGDSRMGMNRDSSMNYRKMRMNNGSKMGMNRDSSMSSRKMGMARNSKMEMKDGDSSMNHRKMGMNRNKMGKNRMNSDDAMNSNNSMSKMNNSASSNNSDMHNGFMMQNGKMMEMKNDALSPMDFNITLVDGTYLTNDGTLTRKNGVKSKLKDGSFINSYGRMMPMKK